MYMCQLFITLDTTNSITLLEQFFTLSETKSLNDGYGIIIKNNNNWIVNKSVNPPYIDKTYKTLLKSNIIIAHLREIYKKNMTKNAIKNEKIIENTHPFSYQNIYFMHHGDLFVEDSNTIKRYQNIIKNLFFKTRFLKHIN